MYVAAPVSVTEASLSPMPGLRLAELDVAGIDQRLAARLPVKRAELFMRDAADN
jgi:hypothetical protein